MVRTLLRAGRDAHPTSVALIRCPGMAGDPGAAGATLLKAFTSFMFCIHNGSLLEALSFPFDCIS